MKKTLIIGIIMLSLLLVTSCTTNNNDDLIEELRHNNSVLTLKNEMTTETLEYLADLVDSVSICSALISEEFHKGFKDIEDKYYLKAMELYE